jgi:hypothetical protein
MTYEFFFCTLRLGEETHVLPLPAVLLFILQHRLFFSVCSFLSLLLACLVAPGIAHGFPDALVEPLTKIFDWMLY